MLISLSQWLFARKSLVDFDVIVKRTSTAVLYRLYCNRSQKWHHKMAKTKRTKYFSSFMGGVENPLWGFTILFCCGIFRFDSLKCHRYMLENLWLSQSIGHRRQCCIVFTVINHKSGTIKWSKQSEQSTFLLLWEVWRTHFGVLPFCFVVEYFGLIV